MGRLRGRVRDRWIHQQSSLAVAIDGWWSGLRLSLLIDFFETSLVNRRAVPALVVVSKRRQRKAA
jgi:hypothetical protein